MRTARKRATQRSVVPFAHHDTVLTGPVRTPDGWSPRRGGATNELGAVSGMDKFVGVNVDILQATGHLKQVMAGHLDIDGDLDEDLGRGRRVTGPTAHLSSTASDKVAALGIKNEDLLGIRDWVTGKDHEQFASLPDGMVAVTVTHQNLKQKMLELRFDLHTTIANLKARLYLHHGTPAESQRLTLRDGGIDICALDDDSKMLGFYSVQSGMEIFVRDVDPHSISRGGGLEDVGLVRKYEMSDEDYDKRQGTVREWIREQRAADPSWRPPRPNQTESGPAPTMSDAAHITVGARCQVAPGARRGIVAFVGAVPELHGEGVWVGVRLDEPLGKNNGTVKGRPIFEAPTGHGTFARPNNVKVGDFPEVLDDLDDDGDEL